MQITAMAKVIAKHQVTSGGPVILVQIENEYYNGQPRSFRVGLTGSTADAGPGIHEYFDQLTETYRENGVVLPTTDNDPGMYSNLVDDVDVYGFDAYPVCESFVALCALRMHGRG